MKSSICCLWLVLTSTTVSAQSLYPKHFRNMLVATFSFGYGHDDSGDFNRWGRLKGYNYSGSYIPLNFDLLGVFGKGEIVALSFGGAIRTTSTPSPADGYMTLKGGYNIRSFGKRLHLNLLGGLGLCWQGIRFFGNPPAEWDQYGYDPNRAYARRTGMLFSPEIMFYLDTSKSKQSTKSKSGVFASLGTNVHFLQGRWKYGEMLRDGAGDSYFDSVAVTGVPNVMTNYLYLRVGFAIGVGDSWVE